MAMDSRLLFLHHPAGGNKGTRVKRLSLPNGHGRFRRKMEESSFGEITSAQISSRKSLLSMKVGCPYRNPTLVGTLKSEKVFETTLVKELGKSDRSHVVL